MLGGLGWKVVSRGFLIGLATLLAFMFVYHRDPNNLPYAQTVAFSTLVLAQPFMYLTAAGTIHL
ncbi:cation transporting ATPase C-terminal domain-containing protein [Bacillus sp. SL00103]